MKLQIKVFFAFIAIALLLSVTAPAHATNSDKRLHEDPKLRFTVLALHQTTVKNFTYKEDPAGTDDWAVYDAIKPFAGDCEDFAFSLQRLIGAGSVFLAYNVEGGEIDGQRIYPNHAVYIYAGLVWMMNGQVIAVRKYMVDGRHIFFQYGDITPEQR